MNRNIIPSVTVYADGSIYHPLTGTYQTTVPGADRSGHGARLLSRRSVLRALRIAGIRTYRGATITLKGGYFGDREV